MGFKDLFKKKETASVPKGGALFSEEEVKTIWDSYGKLRTLVSTRGINNMEDAIAPLDKAIPSLIAGKTISKESWKNTIKGYIKFYLIYDLLAQNTSDRTAINNIQTLREKIVHTVMLLIHKYNQQNPMDPVFYSLITVDAYKEKFMGSPVPISVMGGVSIDVSFVEDKDFVKEGLAAEYYYIERFIRKKVDADEQGEFGDTSWSAIKKAIGEYNAIREKLVNEQYGEITDSEWNSLFTIWSLILYKLKDYNEFSDSVPFNEAVRRAITYCFRIPEEKINVDISKGVDEATVSLKKDKKLGPVINELAKLTVKEGADCYTSYKYKHKDNIKYDCLSFLSIIYAGMQILLDKVLDGNGKEELFNSISELLSRDYGMEMIYYVTSPNSHSDYSKSEAPKADEWKKANENIRNICCMLEGMLGRSDRDNEVDDVVQAISDYIIEVCEEGKEPDFMIRYYANLHNFSNDVRELFGIAR